MIFLQNVLGKTNEISFDVVGLYSNIPHGYHLEAIQHWLDLDEFPESLHPRFSKEFVLESAKFILENNNLNFDMSISTKSEVRKWVPYLPKPTQI